MIGDSVGGVTLLTRQWGYDIIDAIKVATGMETYVFYVDSAVLGNNYDVNDDDDDDDDDDDNDDDCVDYNYVDYDIYDYDVTHDDDMT